MNTTDGKLDVSTSYGSNFDIPDPELDVILSVEDVCPFPRSEKMAPIASYELSTATADILKQELESCQQLHELEPDNKWTLLTIVLLMRAINPLTFEEETLLYLSKLEAVDAKRKHYYKDLRSKFVIENAVERLTDDMHHIDLHGKEITTLYHMEYLAHLKSVDISNNKLLEYNGLQYLQNVKRLNIKNNQKDVSKATINLLPNLEDVSV